MDSRSWMIYGATGYTGELVAQEAILRAMKPVLAGRSEAAVKSLADRLNLRWKAFGLDEPDRVREGIRGMRAVLHCAGPFSATSRPMVDACLAERTHYLDITGEIDVFEAIHARTGVARAAGVVLLPGVGFDVVPSDCLAAALAETMPGATHLELAFAGSSKVSRGTLKTMIEKMPKKGRIRRDGRIETVPNAYRVREVAFPHRTLTAVSIPWGDVSTAFYSTGIPNIVVYTAMPKRRVRILQALRPVMPLLKLSPVQSFLKAQVDKRVKGPSEEERRTGRMYLWGRVSDDKGLSREGTAELPEGYHFTVLAALASIERVLDGKVPPGAWTPSRAFGHRFMSELPGTRMSL